MIFEVDTLRFRPSFKPHNNDTGTDNHNSDIRACSGLSRLSALEKGEEMKTEIQDLAWRCLPKEAREEIKKDYNSHPSVYHPYFNEGYEEALKIYFGHHNLTSDEEPSELLFAERKRVQDYYESALRQINAPCSDPRDAYENQDAKSQKLVLENIFGDKCLSDKEPSVQVGDKVRIKGEDKVRVVRRILPDGCIMFGDKGNTYALKDIELCCEQPSVQCEPKFKVGDKVRVIDIEEYADEITEIIAVDKSDPIAPYKLDLLDDEGGGIWCDGNAIEPYTEPKFNVGDKFRFKKNHSEVHTVASICEDGKICFWEEDADGLSKQYLVNPEYIEPYTEPKTKDNNNMEEKN